LRAQLGFLRYYRRFIPNFSKTAKPLNQLLSEDEGWKGGKEQERAWTTLKEAVKTALLLKLPNPDEPFLLYTDWSSSGMCTVLCQEEKRNGEGGGVRQQVIRCPLTTRAPGRRWQPDALATSAACCQQPWKIWKWRSSVMLDATDSGRKE
ncbi:hypothetical protein CLOM_g6328, partial [Closterium sp. NIES-68]